MLKKIIAASSAVVIAATGLSMTAAAENDKKTEYKLPFELEAPTGVAVSSLNGADSQTSTQLSYSMNNSMSEWLGKYADSNSHDKTLEALKKDYGYDDLYINAQVDWAIDDKENGWHWSKYWDGEIFKDGEGREQWAGFGMDKDYKYQTSSWDCVAEGVNAETTNGTWALRGGIVHPDDPGESVWFYGNDDTVGVKSQLKDDQYTLKDTSEPGEKELVIDWTKHTAYFRVRWAITVCIDKEEGTVSRPVFSDWSESVGRGKDEVKAEPLTKETLKPPVITDLRYYEEEFNGYPQIACKLEVPDDLKNSISAVTANGGGITIEWEARVPDGEWVGLQGDGKITAGENVIALQNLAESIIKENSENGKETSGTVLKEGSPVELRARYYCNQYESYGGEFIGEIYTDYSPVLTFGTQEMSKTEESVAESSVEESSAEISKVEVKPDVGVKKDKAEKKDNKCSLCGFCPQPLGLCIFIWIAILVAVIIIVIVIIIVVKKSKKDDSAPAPDVTRSDDDKKAEDDKKEQ